MSKEGISNRTGKKKLKAIHAKVNPDALKEIERQVKKKKFPSRNNAINTALEEKFLPENNNNQ